MRLYYFLAVLSCILCVTCQEKDSSNDLKNEETRQEYIGGYERGTSQNYGPVLRNYVRFERIIRRYVNQGNNYGDSSSRNIDNEYGYDDDRENYGEYGGQHDESYYRERMERRLDRLYGYTGPTANDEPENLLRPCSLDDWQCIRKFFASNSQCTPAYGPIPDPYIIQQNTVYFASVNMTIVFPNYRIRGFSSAKITEFYVNKKSGNLVIAIDVQNLNLTSPRAYLRYKRTAKESIVLADSSTVNIRSVTFTAVIPNVPHMRLEDAEIHADTDDANPDYTFGPGAFNSTDPDVITANLDFRALLPINVREGLLFLTPLFVAKYIQDNICDFGLKLVST